ncbi:MAG: hypothetical protein ABI685_13280 [Ferruginibacter sp.]
MIIKQLHAKLLVFTFFILVITGCSKKDELTGLVTGNTENTKAVGASAKDLLASTKYTSIKIEIQFMPTYPPNATAIDNLVNFLNGLINKPGGISVVQSTIGTLGKTEYSLTDISNLEKNNRTVFTSGTQIGINFLYVDGGYTEANVLGFAYRNTSMCLFGKTLYDNSGGFGQPSRLKLETTILEHEFAHLLGLVNLGSPMQVNHEDASHGNHCNNANCLMYYAAQTTGIGGVLMNGSVPVLDANCKADLTANGGK